MESTVKSCPPKVSVIIPFFNAQRHLRTCLASAASQSLKDIELICVDDCSTDNSRQIVLDYVGSDSRFRLIEHDINRGEGWTRNTGLDAALGEYIFHLDADDEIPTGALELLYTQAVDNNSDMVKGGYLRVFPDGSSELIKKSTPATKIINTNIQESEFLKNIPSSHCSYLYRRELLNSYQIRYPTDLSIGLDLISLARALCKARSVTLLTEPVYHYHQTDESVVRGAISKRMPLDAIKALAMVTDILQEHGLGGAARHRLTMWRHQIDSFWLRAARDLPKEDCSQIFNAFRNLIADNSAPWNMNTPLRQRYILALLLANKDDEAIAFMRTEDASEGISDRKKLRKSLEFVLTQAPADTSALYSLGRLELANGNPEEAIDLFRAVLEIDKDNLDAHLKLAVALRRAGHPEDGRNTIEAIEANLIESAMSDKQSRLFQNERVRLSSMDGHKREGRRQPRRTKGIGTENNASYENCELRELIDIKMMDIENLHNELSESGKQVAKFQKTSRNRQTSADDLDKKLQLRDAKIGAIEHSLTYRFSLLLNRALFKPGLNTLLFPVHCLSLIFDNKNRPTESSK